MNFVSEYLLAVRYMWLKSVTYETWKQIVCQDGIYTPLAEI